MATDPKEQTVSMKVHCETCGGRGVVPNTPPPGTAGGIVVGDTTRECSGCRGGLVERDVPLSKFKAMLAE